MKELMALFLEVALQSEIWRDQEEDEVKPKAQSLAKEVKAGLVNPPKKQENKQTSSTT